MLRWGICCCGRISQDFVSAITEFPNDNIKLVGVAARSIEQAKQFAEKFSIKHSFGSYEELAHCDEIDVVYIGAVNTQHLPLVRLFLGARKHVLVEKPMGLNASETAEMIELARQKQLFFMEAIWSRCFPIYKMIQKKIQDGDLGNISHLNINFQTDIGDVYRVRSKELGGGGLLDIGIYCVQLALFVFAGKEITSCQSNIKCWESGVDCCGQILLEFGAKKTAFITYHTEVKGDTSATIYGDKGIITMPEKFWCPDKVIMNGSQGDGVDYRTARQNEDIKYNFDHSWGLIHEARHVTDCIARGMTESDIMPLDESLRIAQIMEKALTLN